MAWFNTEGLSCRWSQRYSKELVSLKSAEIFKCPLKNEGVFLRPAQRRQIRKQPLGGGVRYFVDIASLDCSSCFATAIFGIAFFWKGAFDSRGWGGGGVGNPIFYLPHKLRGEDFQGVPGFFSQKKTAPRAWRRLSAVRKAGQFLCSNDVISHLKP